MKAFRKFIPFAKVEEQKDGSLFVYGLVTAEKADLEDEICDYETTKPYYQKLVARYAKATAAVDGMEQSIAPLREMHQLKAVGCGKSINFDDDAKTIHMGFHVVEAEACKKVKAGVLIGFSQGGDYVKQWVKGKFTWYTADPGEVSLVDSPCLEDALIQTLVEKTFTYVQPNGSTELRKFHVESAKKLATSDPARDGFVILEVEKSMKPELLKKLKELGKGTVSLTKEEMEELAGLAEKFDALEKAGKSIGQHLDNLHKMHSDHCGAMSKAHGDFKDDAHAVIGKCMKALGTGESGAGHVSGGGEKAKDATFTKAELDAAVAKAVEEAKKVAPAAGSPETFTKADVEKLVNDAIEKATKQDPANKTKLLLVPRPGDKNISTTAPAAPANDESLSKSVGF